MLTDGRTDDGWTSDAGATGILIAHLGAFGSGELINEIESAELTPQLYPYEPPIQKSLILPASRCLPGKFAHLNDSNNLSFALWFPTLS